MTSQTYNSSIAFLYRGYWSHRRKIMSKDGTILYRRMDGFSTPEEAEESYYKHLKEFESERKKLLIPTINKNINFKDYMVYWINEIYPKKVQSSTIMVISFAIHNFILPNISYDIKLKLVTATYIEELLNRIKPYSKSAAHKSRQALYLAFKDAQAYEFIPNNIISNVKTYKSRRKDITILSKEELKKFLSIASTGNWYLEILLALFCGLRKGEILGLKFSDFDLENQTVSIQRQIANEYTLNKNEFGIDFTKQVERDPKTVNGIRILKVPKIIITELAKRKQLIEIESTKVLNYQDNNYISIQKNGVPSHLNSLYTYLYRTCTKYGIKRISVHNLRHMYATILIEQGVSLAKISALLGHSSIHTTFDFYCDVMEEKERIMNFVNNTFPVEVGEDNE
ncbi:MAG: site-specific integrase [Firmicutes bacterium]|nr:site-specific integrase [Bacillota bacterium]